MKPLFRLFLFCASAALASAQVSGTDYVVRTTSSTTGGGGGYTTLNAIGAVLPVSSAQQTALDAKQATLVSATNIKTINGASVLGSGDLVVSGSAAWGSVTGTLANQTDLQAALDAKLATNGSAASLTSFPTLNQNTTGSAATLTTGRTINGTSFNGSANITLGNGSVTLAQLADMATASVFYRKTAATGVPEVQSLATLKTDLGLTGTNSGDQTITLTGDVTGSGTGSFATAIKASVSLTTPVIGAATGTSLAVTGTVTSSGTAGIGYATGAGGTVTQLTNKTTGVTLNKISGQITMNGAALAAAAEVAFTLTNSTIAATDVVVVNIQSVGTAGAYFVTVGAVANGSCSITVGNCSAGSLSQALVLNFVVIKGVAG